MKTTLYVVRHGQARHNTEYRLNEHNRPPSNLTEKGISQAKQAANELKDVNLAALYSSELVRAKQTADEIASYHKKLKIVVDPRVNEYRSGFHEKRGPIWILRLFLSRNRSQKRFGRGETLNEAKARIEEFLTDIEKKHRGKTVCIVAHQHTIQAINAILLDTPYGNPLKNQVHNGSVHMFQL